MAEADRGRPAPELDVERWFNAPEPPSLGALQGEVVLIHAFQMLCPGCVGLGTPQAQKAHTLFGASGLKVIGLHTVFEHHDAMTPVSLAAFIHEYRLTFPIGVDRADGSGPVPVTMARYGLQGTPSMVLIGRSGRIRHQAFGHVDDMLAGALIMEALAEGR